MPDAAPVMTEALVDGQPAERIGLGSRAFQFGDGLFETIAVVDAAPCHWQRHLARLLEGSQRLRLPPPDTDVLGHEAAALCADRASATLKIYWTAGDSARGYTRPPGATPRRILQVFGVAAGARHQHTWQLTWCRQRWSENPQLAGIKHLNRLEQVLARDELSGTDFDEGLMLGQDGRVVSGTMTNLLLQVGDDLVTPSLDGAGIRGVTRDLVIDAARRHGSAVSERPLSIDAVRAADAVFVCNSLVGIVRVASIADVPFETSIPEHRAIAFARQSVHRPDARGWI
jgi:4-amino-4-deoxychorismate lyase